MSDKDKELYFMWFCIAGAGAIMLYIWNIIGIL